MKKRPVLRSALVGLTVGGAAGLCVWLIVATIIALPQFAPGYPFALLPLLVVGPLIAGRLAPDLRGVVIGAIVGGTLSAVIAAGGLHYAVNQLGESRWTLTSAASTPPMPPLPRLGVLPGVLWTHQDILFFQPPLALALAMIYAALILAPRFGVQRRLQELLARQSVMVETKLRITFGIMIAVTVLVAWFGFNALEDTHLRGHRLQIYNDWGSHSDELATIIDEMATLSPGDARVVELARQRDGVIDHLRSAPRHDQISAAPAAFRQIGARMVDRLNDVEQDLIGFERVAMNGGPRAERLAAELEATRSVRLLQSEAEKGLRDEINSIDRDHHGTLVGMFSIVIGVIGLGSLISRAIADAITAPILAIGKQLRKLAAGDFSTTLRVQNGDELGRLGAEINHVTAELGRLYELERRERAGSEARYQTLFEDTPDAILLADGEGRLVDVNPAATHFLGGTRESLIGSQVASLLVTPTAAPGQSLNNWNGELYLRHADGAWLPVESRSTTIKTPDATYEVAIIRDIRDRRVAEDTLQVTNARLQSAVDELRETQEQVVRQERLRALGQMASGIAHDLNNSLAPVVGFSELLMHRAEMRSDETRLNETLKLIHTAASDTADVVSRLREFYRPADSSDQVGEVDLTELVPQIVSLTQPKWKDESLAHGRTIDVVLDVHPVEWVHGSASALREAITNLIFNACDAMPDGGTIHVRTLEQSGQPVIEVSDTGIGMTEEVRTRCLEPFFTTKGARGTGLGLGMVWGVVNRHGAEIEIESEPGHGTTVRIIFPARSDCSAMAEPTAPAFDSSIDSSHLNVLVADDDPLVRRMLDEMLKSCGHVVTAVDNGEDLIQRYQPGRYDVVITDRAMPRLNGDQAALEIKRRDPAQPVMMLTGFGALLQSADEHPEGVDLLLSKPVNLSSLIEALKHVRGGRAVAA